MVDVAARSEVGPLDTDASGSAEVLDAHAHIDGERLSVAEQRAFAEIAGGAALAGLSYGQLDDAHTLAVAREAYGRLGITPPAAAPRATGAGVSALERELDSRFTDRRGLHRTQSDGPEYHDQIVRRSRLTQGNAVIGHE